MLICLFVCFVRFLKILFSPLYIDITSLPSKQLTTGSNNFVNNTAENWNENVQTVY